MPIHSRLFSLARLSIAAASLLAATVAARADTVFNLNATLPSGTVTGTLTLNSTSTAFSGINLSVTNGGSTYQFSSIDYQAQYSSVDYYIMSKGGTAFLDLYLATNTLAGYQGSNVCSQSLPCDFGFGSNASGLFNNARLVDQIQQGSVTPLAPAATTAATPEPSSLLLLATGILGGAGTCIRRLRNA